MILVSNQSLCDLFVHAASRAEDNIAMTVAKVGFNVTVGANEHGDRVVRFTPADPGHRPVMANKLQPVSLITVIDDKKNGKTHVRALYDRPDGGISVSTHEETLQHLQM